MGVKIVGQTFTSKRTILDLWGFDHDVLGFRGEIGLPEPCIMELYGPEHSGKTTTALHIGAKVSNKGDVIAFCDTEGTTQMSQDYAETVLNNAGMEGTLQFVDMFKGDKHRKHEDMLHDTLKLLQKSKVKVAILDSIGLFTPATELKKKIGERDVGQKPKTIADLSRKIMWYLRETAYAGNPKVFIMVNHVHPQIGGKGMWTPGGLTKQAAASVRLWIRRRESDTPKHTGNFASKVVAQKLKIGSGHPGRIGHIYFVPGEGIDENMSALYDAWHKELVVRPTGGVVTVKGEKLAKIGTLLKRSQEGKTKDFDPIYAALEEQYA